MTQAWNSFEPQKLDKNFVTLQGCLDEIIQLDGDNNYKMDKDGILRLHGRLPENLPVSEQAREVLLKNNLLDGPGGDAGIS